jgi:hypothetical protein
MDGRTGNHFVYLHELLILLTALFLSYISNLLIRNALSDRIKQLTRLFFNPLNGRQEDEPAETTFSLNTIKPGYCKRAAHYTMITGNRTDLPGAGY